MKFWKRMTLLMILCMVLSMLVGCGGDDANAGQGNQGGNDKVTVEDQQGDDKQEETEALQAPEEEYLLIRKSKGDIEELYGYNSEGVLVQVTTIRDEQVRYISYYTYSEGENGTTLCHVEPQRAEGFEDVVAFQYDYVYDANGNCIREAQYMDGSFEGLNLYEYNDQNQLIKSEWYKDNENELREMIRYFYDENGYLIREEFYYYGSEEMSGYTIYKYNELGEEIYQQKCNADGTSALTGEPVSEEPMYVWEKEYDDNGRLTSAKKKYADGVGGTLEKLLYTYDEFGGIIQMYDNDAWYDYAPASQVERVE